MHSGPLSFLGAIGEETLTTGKGKGEPVNGTNRDDIHRVFVDVSKHRPEPEQFNELKEAKQAQGLGDFQEGNLRGVAVIGQQAQGRERDPTHYVKGEPGAYVLPVRCRRLLLLLCREDTVKRSL